MTEDQITQIIITALVGLASGSGAWALFKRKLAKFVKLATDVNEAVKDDTVTEAEFKTIWADFWAFVSPDEKPKASP